MGVGTNVQERLAALHHIDGPWRPADVEQREGRIIRQGNTVRLVKLYRYVTEGSFDAYVWQTLETKAKFIAQVMSGDDTIRTLEDAELASLSYAEVKALASGNPLVIEKAGVDAEVMKLSMLASKFRNQQFSNRHEIADLPGRIERYKGALAAAQADVKLSEAIEGEQFQMELDGRIYADREEAGKRILGAYAVLDLGQTRTIGKIGGFELVISKSKSALGKWGFVLAGNREYDGDVATSPKGVVRRIEHLAKVGPAHDELQLKERIERSEVRLEQLKAVIDSKFEYEDRLIALLARQEEINRELCIFDGDKSVDMGLAKAA